MSLSAILEDELLEDEDEDELDEQKRIAAALEMVAGRGIGLATTFRSGRR